MTRAAEGPVPYRASDESRFLTVEEVLYLHRRLVEDMGGEHGLLNPGALESAVAQPAMTAFGHLLHPTLLDQAAAYLFHLVANHPFCDGNKRIGLHASLVFLDTNGATISGTPDDWYQLTMGVATSAIRKPEVTRRMASFVQRG